MNKIFKDFPVYNKALSVVEGINVLCNRIRGREFYFLKDQVSRAMSSVVLNLAEGSGKWRKRDKSNFYRISKASVFESISALDLFVVYRLVDEKNVKQFKNELFGIANNLQALIISVEKRDR